jgi:hypothetical protein
MFIATLFPIAKLWYQLGCLPMKKWIKKMSHTHTHTHTHTMESYSTIKKNEKMSFAGKWMEMGINTLSKISQAHKGKDHIFLSHMWNLQTRKRT